MRSALIIFFLPAWCIISVVSHELLRIASDVDESSCLCGVNHEILDRLELILRGGIEAQKCQKDTDGNLNESASNDQGAHDNSFNQTSIETIYATEHPPNLETKGTSEADLSSETKTDWPSSPSSQDLQEQSINQDDNEHKNKSNSFSSNLNQPEVQPGWVISSNSHTMATSYSTKPGSEVDQDDSKTVTDAEKDQIIEYLAAEIHRLETLILKTRPSAHKQPANMLVLPTTDASVTPQLHVAEQVVESRPSQKVVDPEMSNQQNDRDSDKFTLSLNSQSFNTGFLNGIASSGVTQNSLIKLNQTLELKPEEMTNALQSTIPNVVSNIFTNIQSLTEHTKGDTQASTNGKANGNLTSIDGSTVSVTGNTTAQITAQGERLFEMWVEHQLRNLHLTNAVANYIRKSALNLFRRIARQYVERVERIGGNMEDNVRKATQAALSNTQRLTGFLLKNYVDFAGGLMQIIGEQVSRVGKQLDTTGETISHMSLNPMDIVANVIDSLPNPSDYSKYFRAFGKQLMGENNNGQQQADIDPELALNQSDQKQGLIRKTMGALSKTMGWLG